VLVDGLVEALLEAVGVHVAPGEADDREAAGEKLVAGEVVEGWNELAVGEVAGGAEDDDDAGFGSPAEAKAFPERILHQQLGHGFPS
jgi:hypothetical protein